MLPAEVEAQKEMLAQLEQELKEQMRSFQEKVAETQVRSEESSGRRKSRVMDTGHMMMMNLNPEIQLTGKIRYSFVNFTTQTIGNSNAKNDKKGKRKADKENSDGDRDSNSSTDSDSTDDGPDIDLTHDGVYERHAKIETLLKRCFLAAADDDAAKSTWINGKSIFGLLKDPWRRDKHDGWALLEGAEEDAVTTRGPEYEEEDPPGVLLHHGDRIVFGRGMFLFVDPAKEVPEMLVLRGSYTFQKARKELPDDWKDVIVSGGGKGLQTVMKAVMARVAAASSGHGLSTRHDERGRGDEADAGVELRRTRSRSSHGDGGDDSDDSAAMMTGAMSISGAEAKEKDKEIAELKAMLAASQKVAEEAAAGEAREREQRERLEVAHREAENSAGQALDIRLTRYAEKVRDQEAELAQAALVEAAAAAKARLEESILRLQGSMIVARSMGADSSVVAGADAKLENIQKHIQMTEKLVQAFGNVTKDTALQFRIDIQKAKAIHGMPVDREILARAEARLKEVTATR